MSHEKRSLTRRVLVAAAETPLHGYCPQN